MSRSAAARSPRAMVASGPGRRKPQPRPGRCAAPCRSGSARRAFGGAARDLAAQLRALGRRESLEGAPQLELLRADVVDPGHQDLDVADLDRTKKQLAAKPGS